LRKFLWLLTILLCLSGCDSENSALKEGMAFRDKLLSGQGCRFSVQITADYGEHLYYFEMDCAADSVGDMTFCVTAPESIAGIEGSLSYAGGTLDFADTALQFDLLADDQLTPVSSPWILLKTLRSGYIASACYEEELLRLTVDDSYEEDALRLDIWLRDECPVRSDVLYDGKRILSMEVKDFEIL